MNLLLDSCALLALAGQCGKLPRGARQALDTAERVWVSPVTAWEIAIKLKTGKLQISSPPIDWFHEVVTLYHLEESMVTSSLLCAAAGLPLIHRDPFDRVLVATALARDLTLVTSDRIIPTYPGVNVIW